MKAGTLMHEMGHFLGLTHSCFYFDSLTANNKNYTPTVEGNCKPNFQSVMTYEGQLIGLNTGSVDAHNKPIRTVDYSGQFLQTIDEQSGGGPNLFTTPTPAPYKYTFWYEPWPGVGGQANAHCDGTPKSPGEHMIQHEDLANAFFWVAGQDTNFDGFKTSLRGHNDWQDTLTNGLVTAPGINLQQVSAAGSQSSSGGKGFGGNGGGKGFGGNGGGKGFGGNGGGKGFGGNGGGKGFGGNGGGTGFGELSVETANAQTYPPQNLTASENNSARTITLNWAEPAFGVIVQYNIYRSADGGHTFTQIASVSGSTFSYTDGSVAAGPPCVRGGYQYFVTAVINNPGPQESPMARIPLKLEVTGI